MADDGQAGGFLGRWSQRKAAVRAGAPLPPEPAVAAQTGGSGVVPHPSGEPAPAGGVPAVAAPASPVQSPPPTAAPPTLQQARQLTRESDFTPFVARGVAPEVRNAAMKQLFADPHFNVMDGLDIYIDDYSRPDPLPLALLRQMASAQFMQLVEPQPTPAPPSPVADTPLACAGGPAAPAERSEIRPARPLPPGPTTIEQHDQNPDMRLQPDHAAGRHGAIGQPE
jgi:Protein of unknown function (DUF3306)